MCYTSPGPRCTPHAKVKLAEANTKWIADPSEKNHKALILAQQLYDSTPGGQKELSEQIDETKDSTALELRLEAGKLLRAEQFRKMFATHKGFLKANKIRRGLNAPGDEASKEIVAELTVEGKAWKESLDKEEKDALSWYGMNGHEGTNILLGQGEGSAAFAEYCGEGFRGKTDTDAHVERLTGKIALLDSAIAKAAKPEEPRLLYRSYRTPGAKDSETPEQVTEELAQQFTEGSTINFPAYLSTTIDSDLVIYNATSGRHKEEEHIVFEIISSRGAVMHDERMSGMIQSQEREVLLPRSSKMQVAGVLRNVPFNNSRVYDRTDHSSGPWPNDMANGSKKKMRVTVVQLIDVTDE